MKSFIVFFLAAFGLQAACVSDVECNPVVEEPLDPSVYYEYEISREHRKNPATDKPFKPVILNLQVAFTKQQLREGLMNRMDLPENHGMLFDFGSSQVQRMWMKNTLIPLDMLFIDEDGFIKKIHAHAVEKDLTRISSDDPVRFVIEINAEEAERLNIKVGDRLNLQQLGY